MSKDQLETLFTFMIKSDRWLMNSLVLRISKIQQARPQDWNGKSTFHKK